MENIYVMAALCLPFIILFLPKKSSYLFTFFTEIILLAFSSYLAVNVLYSGNPVIYQTNINFWSGTPVFLMDTLSAVFTLVVNFTMLTGTIYAGGYLKSYQQTKSKIEYNLHVFSLLWLHISMLLVLTMQQGLPFLVVWELMSLSSFLLILFESEKKETIKTAINYLIQMHIGFLFLVFGFLIIYSNTLSANFSDLQIYFKNHSNLLLFIVFFIGFGIKAGFVPFHTWLPQAHPAAPSHVSGIMSGVMIKMGIYGILRILSYVQTDWLWIGLFVMAISAITGLYGIMQTIVQHDFKKLLAFSSIENIGIIGIGIGLGSLGIAFNNPLVSILGFAGALMHTINHSLFKSLLFFTAGAVYKACGTKDMEKLGGILKKMPQTGVFFLVGAIAITGVPPLNGFISEFLIFLGFFKALSTAGLYQAAVLLLGMLSITIIGGLAIFCFTKAFGILFLGVPRSTNAHQANEAKPSMLVSFYIIAAGIALIIFVPQIFVKNIANIVVSIFHIDNQLFTNSTILKDFSQISIITGIFVILTGLLLFIRQKKMQKSKVTIEGTWGCGYTAIDERQQYTSSSFSYHFGKIAQPILHTKVEFEPIAETDIFPKTRKFKTIENDVIKKYVIEDPIRKIRDTLKKIAFLQTGRIENYILYAFIFILVVAVLTFFNII